MKGHWTCQKVNEGVKCAWVNPNRKTLCEQCRKPKRDRSGDRPQHLSALDLPYEYFAEVNGGDHCGICGVKPKPGKVLNRDHEHKGVGIVRGLLCWRHNKALEMFGDDPALLRAAIAYLARVEERRAT